MGRGGNGAWEKSCCWGKVLGVLPCHRLPGWGLVPLPPPLPFPAASVPAEWPGSAPSARAVAAPSSSSACLPSRAKARGCRPPCSWVHGFTPWCCLLAVADRHFTCVSGQHAAHVGWQGRGQSSRHRRGGSSGDPHGHGADLGLALLLLPLQGAAQPSKPCHVSLSQGRAPHSFCHGLAGKPVHLPWRLAHTPFPYRQREGLGRLFLSVVAERSEQSFLSSFLIHSLGEKAQRSRSGSMQP